MRLRLTICRNGLPDTSIIWAIETSSSPTIYQLLEQVNEIVPIESPDHWGLEDYAVEILGSNGTRYECLHFQYIVSVMKEDDEVVIRCLHSNDVRKRRLSGRTQITADGKRLFDGVPLGRLFLRKIIDRPVIKICPKNPKELIETEYYNGREEFDAFESLNQKQMLEAKGNQNKHLIPQFDSNDEDSETDEDYLPSESDTDSDLSSENNSLQMKQIENKQPIISADSNPEVGNDDCKENYALEEDPISKDIEGEVTQTKSQTGIELFARPRHKLTKSKEKHHSHDNDLNRQTQTRLLHSAFPSTSIEVCKYVIEGANGDLGEAWEVMAIGFSPRKNRNEVIKQSIKPVKRPISRSSASSNSLIFSNSNLHDIVKTRLENSSTPLKKKSLLDENDLCGTSLGSSSKKKTKLHTKKRACSAHNSCDIQKLKYVPSVNSRYISSSKNPIFNKKSVPDGVQNSQKMDVDDNCSDENRESSVTNLALQGNCKNNTLSLKNSSHTSLKRKKDNNSSSDDDSTDSSSASDESSEQSSSPSVYKSSGNVLNVTSKKAASHPLVAPGKGKKATQRRNQRRRVNNTMLRLKEKGILPAGTTKDEFRILYENQKSSATHQKDLNIITSTLNPNTLNSNEVDDEFQRRRKELLESLQSGRGVDVCLETKNKLPTEKPLKCQTEIISHASSTSSTKDNHVDAELNSVIKKANDSKSCEIVKCDLSGISKPDISADHSEIENDLAPVNQKDTNHNNRSVLDLDAGKRMLYRAMGLKPPKTNQDKEKIRSELTKNAKIISIAKRPYLDIHEKEPDILHSEAWREKIIYRAVECVEKGIELSEPPFPFTQRWDVKQRTNKRKKNQKSRNQSLHHQDQLSKKQKKNHSIETQNIEEPNVTEIASEPCKESVPDNQELNEVNFSSSLKDNIDDEKIQHPEDLPPLPDDLSGLVDLTLNQAKIGMIIAFKQLEVSVATRWQPQISDYQTAIITSLDNNRIQLQLACRDRRASEKLYNDYGDRVYSGFETISVEEAEEIDDDGCYDLHFDELLDPKIVKYPEESMIEHKPTQIETEINEPNLTI